MLFYAAVNHGELLCSAAEQKSLFSLLFPVEGSPKEKNAKCCDILRRKSSYPDGVVGVQPKEKLFKVGI